MSDIIELKALAVEVDFIRKLSQNIEDMLFDLLVMDSPGELGTGLNTDLNKNEIKIIVESLKVIQERVMETHAINFPSEYFEDIEKGLGI